MGARADVAVDHLAAVVVSDLVVRSGPGVDPGTSTILADGLTTDDRVFVVDGPVDADGYAWYLVAPLERDDGMVAPFGWVAAASRSGEPWIEGIEAACPATVTLASVIELHRYERVVCFGDAPFSLDAPLVSAGIGGGPWSWEPDWLVQIGGLGLALDDTGDRTLAVRVPPGGPSFGPGGAVRVTGHFNDAAALTCQVTSADPATPAPSREEAILICRSEFVLDSVP